MGVLQRQAIRQHARKRVNQTIKGQEKEAFLSKPQKTRGGGGGGGAT